MRTTFRACAVLLLSGATFTACGGGGGVTGTYVHEEKLPDGSSGKLILELKAGNKAVITIKGGPDDQALPSVEGTYSVEGDKVTVSMAGDTDVYTLKDGALTSAEAFGETMVLKKQ